MPSFPLDFYNRDHRDRMRRWLFIVPAVACVVCCQADVDGIGPPQPPGPIGPPSYTRTQIPFYIIESGWTSVRYQQVYSASIFTNVPAECIYITSFRFVDYPSFTGVDASDWTMTLQLNLSSTQRSADNLSFNFSENVGSDDTVVFGPTRINFNSDFPHVIFFDHPFRYGAAQGNLLFDVRVSDASGTLGPRTTGPTDLLAVTPSTDGVSRVWATNAGATVATALDTTALIGGFHFSSVPSLRSEFHPVYAGSLSNMIVIAWPAQPSTFVLQKSPSFARNSPGQAVSNKIFLPQMDPSGAIVFPASEAGSAGFFRLVWPSGQPAQQTAVLGTTSQPRGTLPTK